MKLTDVPIDLGVEYCARARQTDHHMIRRTILKGLRGKIGLRDRL